MQNKILREGFASFCINSITDTDKEGNPLVSAKTGTPMIRLDLLVTDKNGDSCIVWDFILINLVWKIMNLEKCLGDKILKEGKWDKRSMIYSTGMCTIKTQHDEKYGSKTVIKSYMEADHMKILLSALEPENRKPKETEIQKTQLHSKDNEPEESAYDGDDLPF